MPDVLRISIIVQAIPELYLFLNFLYKIGWYVPAAITGVVDFVRPYIADRLQMSDDKDKYDIMSVILKRNEEVTLESEKMGYQELISEAVTIIGGM